MMSAQLSQYGITSPDSRIQKIRRHESLVDFTDIYDLPTLFREVTDQSLESFYEQTNNDFYCNAYLGDNAYRRYCGTSI